MRRRLAQLLDKLETNIRLLEAFLIVKDPSAARSAEVFEALLGRVESGYRARRRHLAQLADLHRVVLVAGSVEAVTARIQEFMDAEGVSWFDGWSSETATLFDIQGPLEDHMRVTSPAYVLDDEPGHLQILRRGTAQAVEEPPAGEQRGPEQPAEPKPAGQSDVDGEGRDQ